MEPIQDTEEFRDHIATVDQKGKRIWVYPKKPSGRFYRWRSSLSWFLLAFLFGMPFIKIGGEPILLFNIIERRFILFGLYFAPQDFHLFVLAMLTLMIFIVLFTVVFGRLFCGWVCPQTIFMEMVFRKIEYWIEGDASDQRKLNAAPWTTEKIFKKTAKQVIFFLIAVLVANTFLAYIIGIDEVIKIATDPVTQHLSGFIAMILFSFAFYFVFAWLREQVCVTICPYGRLQGVLLVKDSIVVAYDHVRGEPRGKTRKAEQTVRKSDPVSKISEWVRNAGTSATYVREAELVAEAPLQIIGDCVDCKLCVQVCPTGIDIRNGTQLECINCTACIDACDDVMGKVGLPKGLIRYDSMNGIELGRKKLLTPRAIGYTAVLGLLIVIQVLMFSSRTEVEALILRTPGQLFQKIDDTHLSNVYNYEIINKTAKEMPVEFRLMTAGGKIKLVGNPPLVAANSVGKGVLFIEMEKDKLLSRKTPLVIEVVSNGKVVDEVKTNFMGPIK